MSLNFRLFLSGDSFPLEAWQLVVGIFRAHPLENDPNSLWRWQWMTESHVWVTVGSVAPPPSWAPPWAQWCVTLDFSREPLAQRFDAASLIALALAELPRSATGVHVLAMDAWDDASADSIATWAKIARRYLDQESVDDIVEWASRA